MSEFLIILKYKAIAFIRPETELKPSMVIKGFFGGIIYLLFAYGIYSVTLAITDQMLNNFRIGLYLYHKFIAVILLIFFITVNIGNVLVSFTTLYKSKDVLHLLTKPVSIKNLFTVKFLDNFFYSSTTLFLLILSALIAYGNFFNLGLGFYFISVFLLLLPYLFIAGLVGVLILFLIIFVSNRIGIKKALGIIIVTYVTGILLFFMVNDPSAAVKHVITNLQNRELSFFYLENDLFLLFPNNWIANAFYWIVKGEYSFAFGYIIFLLTAALLLFITTRMIAGKFYYKSFFIVSDFRLNKKEKEGNEDSLLGFESKTLFSPVFNSELKREFWMFLRDPVQIIHASLLLFLIVIFIANIGGKPFRYFQTYNPDLQTIIYLTIFLFTQFLIASLSLRFIFPHFNLWGEPFWKIKSSPADISKILGVRYLIYLFLMSVIAGAINYFINRKFGTQILELSSVVTFFSVLTMVSINFSLGTIFYNFKEKNPIRIASSQGASISFLVNMIYLVIIISLIFKPLQQYFLRARWFLTEIPEADFSAPLLIIALLSIVTSALFLSVTRNVLRRDY